MAFYKPISRWTRNRQTKSAFKTMASGMLPSLAVDEADRQTEDISASSICSNIEGTCPTGISGYSGIRDEMMAFKCDMSNDVPMKSLE